MVITAALSWFFTSTPPSCETVAAAIAVALANRTIPSSCLNLITFVSPSRPKQIWPVMRGVNACLDNSSRR
jgi:hypothetical protein